MAEKAKNNIIGNLWKAQTKKQKDVGIVLTGSINGVGRVTIWTRKEKREGKNDSDFFMTVDEGGEKKGSSKPKPEPVDDTPFKTKRAKC